MRAWAPRGRAGRERGAGASAHDGVPGMRRTGHADAGDSASATGIGAEGIQNQSGDPERAREGKELETRFPIHMMLGVGVVIALFVLFLYLVIRVPKRVAERREEQARRQRLLRQLYRDLDELRERRHRFRPRV